MAQKEKKTYQQKADEALRSRCDRERSFWETASPLSEPLEIGGEITGVTGSEGCFQQSLGENRGSLNFGTLQRKPAVTISLPGLVPVKKFEEVLAGSPAQPKVLIGGGRSLRFVSKKLPEEGDFTGMTVVFKKGTPASQVKKVLERVQKISEE
ncbi:hypothetical protein ACFLRC_03320 [Candidatus Altiarchaeota archaeon]